VNYGSGRDLALVHCYINSKIVSLSLLIGLLSGFGSLIVWLFIGPLLFWRSLFRTLLDRKALWFWHFIGSLLFWLFIICSKVVYSSKGLDISIQYSCACLVCTVYSNRNIYILERCMVSVKLIRLILDRANTGWRLAEGDPTRS
jgi:hypothetical protein